MLMKCVYKGVSLWNDNFSKSIVILEPEDVVLSLDAEITPHPFSRSYSRVFYKGHIGWLTRDCLKVLAEPDAL
jgi:hypothetical protein